jgi:hypothetical protein
VRSRLTITNRRSHQFSGANARIKALAIAKTDKSRLTTIAFCPRSEVKSGARSEGKTGCGSGTAIIFMSQSHCTISSRLMSSPPSRISLRRRLPGSLLGVRSSSELIIYRILSIIGGTTIRLMPGRNNKMDK